MIKTSVFPLIIGVLFLTGCGHRWFSPRETNPVLEDYVGSFPRELGSMATDAAHRITTIRMSDGKHVSNDEWQVGEFCAEPPPDAMVNMAAQFGMVLALDLTLPEPQSAAASAASGGLLPRASAEGEGKTAFAREIATAMSPLLRRSQGLQWNRDTLSYFCSAFMNRTITKDEYYKKMKWVIEQSKGLVKAEMDNLPAFEVPLQGNKDFPGVTLGTKDVQRISKCIKDPSSCKGD